VQTHYLGNLVVSGISVTIYSMRVVSGDAKSLMTLAQTPCAQVLLRVRGLTVRYAGEASHPALSEIDFDIRPGEIVGILGESGSGKSTVALSILGMLPASADITGSMFFEDKDLLRLDEPGWTGIRGARIAMIFQEPGLALSPVMRVGDQIAEVLRAHRREKKEFRQQVEAMLEEVGLREAERIYKAYPHQLSGGELHRVTIAQALACRPGLVIADEPTRSLDVTRQAEILEVLRESNRKFGCALIFITHSPGLLADFAERVMVMYAGRIVEEGPISRVFRRPLHPYTKGLLQLVPSSLQSPSRAGRHHLLSIPGSLCESDYLSPGCIFASRCYARTEVCQSEPPKEVAPEENRRVSCFNYGK
jgi:peptide/nickel transport system ATP-binding protein